MEQKLVLSSQIARVKNASNTPSDFTTVFDRPIVLGGNQRYVIGLDKVNTMTYSWHNVSPDYQNNIISYHNGTEYKRIEFSNGCYDYTELSDYIKETLIANGDLEPDQPSPITIEFDLTSFKCFVSIIKPFALDLRGSNFGALIGFEPTVIRQTQYGTDIPNITNSLDTLYIHYDLVDNSIVDGEYGDMIYTISTADLRRSYPFKDEPILKGFCEVNKTIINSIRIYITDALGKIINLNKVDTSFTFILKDNKNI